MTVRRARWRFGWLAVLGAAVALLASLFAPAAEAAAPNLIVNPLGTGSGYVTSEPAGIDCGLGLDADHEECAAEIPVNEFFVLTMHNDPHSIFVGFTAVRGSNCAGGSTTCVGYVENPTEVNVEFTGDAQPLTVSVGGEGKGFVAGAGIFCGGRFEDCDSTLLTGTAVTLEAEAEEGSEFTGWGGDVCSGTATTCTFTINEDAAVTADFGPKKKTPPPGGGGGGSGEPGDGSGEPGDGSGGDGSGGNGSSGGSSSSDSSGSTSTPPAPVTTSPLPPPSNEFKLLKTAANKRKGTALLTFMVPGPGTLKLGGQQVKGLTRTVSKAGKATLAIAPKGPLLGKLRAGGSGRVKVSVTFTPTGGTPRTQRFRVALKLAG
jgi:hypothetical protein